MEDKAVCQTVNPHLGICKLTQGNPFWPFASLTNALSAVYTAKPNSFLQEGKNNSSEMDYDSLKKGFDELSSKFVTCSASKQVTDHDIHCKSAAIDAEKLFEDSKSLQFNSETEIHGYPEGPRKGINKLVVQEIVKGVYTLSAPASESGILEGSWSNNENAGGTRVAGKNLNRQFGETLPLDSSSFPNAGPCRKQSVIHRKSAEEVWEYALTSEPIPILLTGKRSFARQSFWGLPGKQFFCAGKSTLKRPIGFHEKCTFATVRMHKIDGLKKISRRPVYRCKESETHRKQKGRTGHVIKQLLSGGFAGVVSRTAVAPLDLIKAYLITSHGLRGSKKSALTICRDIVQRDGWQGLFRGNFVNCIRVAPSKAIELWVFETVRRALNKEGNPLKHMAATIAGGAAGMTGTIATYPLELIRTRISVQPELYSGLAQAVRKIARDEGFLAFYLGLSPSLVGVFPYAATNYFVYDGLRVAYLRSTGLKSVPTLATLMFGAVAAAASSAVTYPLEVARRQMQLSLSGTFVRKSTIGLILDIYKHEGFLALYRGLGTTWLKLIPAAGISFVCYETARLALQIDDASLVQPESPIISEQEG